MSATQAGTTTQVYQVFIKATPGAIWDAITKPEWTERYGYGPRAEYDLHPGGSYRAVAGPELQALGMPEVVVDGEVVAADPPRKLVHTWRFLWDDEVRAEGPTRVTFEIDPVPPRPDQPDAEAGVTRLTVTHELENAPATAAQLAGQVEGAGGGWSYVLSDLKTLLETGTSLEG
ncbi:MAG: SRPBCC family protein [Solirubrobacteraceae bacterium]